jgi:DNA-binding LacI/PurR family transcriptional regulator
MAVSAEHRDFPSLIAEALDALEQHAYAPSAAAQFLAVSTSQLVALLRDHAPALAALNARRLALGKPPLK